MWPLESLQSRHPFHLPKRFEQCYLLCFCFSMERKNFPKMGFFPKCNKCPWWCLFIPVCSIKACEEIPHKEHACMNKYHSEMRRTTRKKIQTNFIFLYAEFLAMTTNNKNYIWRHGVLLFLLFIEALYKRWLTRRKCWCIRWLTALRCITKQEPTATNTNRLSHKIFPAPISLPLSWLSSANQHHPLLSSLRSKKSSRHLFTTGWRTFFLRFQYQFL